MSHETLFDQVKMKFIIEHMEPELNEWAQIEYSHMVEHAGAGNIIVTHLKQSEIDKLPEQFKNDLECTTQSIDTMNLDKSRILLLDPSATNPLSPEDANNFDYFLFGGILGDIPSIDRTKELRVLGYETRHLGPVQLPTDHAVIFSKLVLKDNIQLQDIECMDDPSFKLAKGEFLDMLGFRYHSRNGKPVLAPGMFELWKRQNDEPLN